MTFNSAYALALDMLALELAAQEIFLRIKVPGGIFWEDTSNPSDGATNVLDAAFVDDECLVILAMLNMLTSIFGSLHLELSRSPGKTECLLKYRGKDSVAHYEQWR
eukprot:7016329-Karenia_brevis.AAC.1